MDFISQKVELEQNTGFSEVNFSRSTIFVLAGSFPGAMGGAAAVSGTPLNVTPRYNRPCPLALADSASSPLVQPPPGSTHPPPSWGSSFFLSHTLSRCRRFLPLIVFIPSPTPITVGDSLVGVRQRGGRYLRRILSRQFATNLPARGNNSTAQNTRHALTGGHSPRGRGTD